MAVTITAISPTSGHTGGKTFCEITGTGFQVPVTQPQDRRGYTPKAPPTVAVFFGNVPALMVEVVSSTLIYAVSPPTAPTNDASGIGRLPTVVPVTVANIGPNGTLPGQVATLPAAFTFLLPDLTQESDLTRLVRTWLQLLKAQVTPNVSWPKSTDFDQDTGDFLSVVDLPQLPGLVVADTSLRTNAFYSLRAPVEIDNGDGTFTTKAPPDTVDLVFSLVGVSNNPTELLNLGAAFKRFLHKNPKVFMPRDPAQPSLGSVWYELSWSEGKELKITALANASNLVHFAYDVAIIGFDIEDMPGLPPGGPGDDARQHEATVDYTSVCETVTILPTFHLPAPRREE